MPRQFLIQTAIHVSFWIRWAPRVSLPAMSRSKPLCKSKCGRRVKQSLLLFAAIWTINWSIYSTTGNNYNRRFRSRNARTNMSLGGPRAMCCVALCCSDVKYVVIVLLFATIWTTELTELNWLTDRVCKNVGAWRSLREEGSDADFAVICWDLNNWVRGFVKMLARAYSGVPLVWWTHKRSLLLFVTI